ncbi:MAG TPA: hypothetical protein VJO35_05840 [Terriglobales bacterium]|nr:hypothetical protein [Terriglobales bacterium]
MRPRLGGVLTLLAVIAFAPNVLADSYTYSTSGCFSYGTCSSNGDSSVGFTDILGADATLSFTSTSTSTSGTSFSLGSFDLTSLPGISVYKGTFKLNVDFTDPNAAGSPLVASVLGGVLVNAGGAIITFAPGSELFTYPGGSFTLDLTANPIVINRLNQAFSLNATIVGMPEGSSLAMLGISGLLLVGAFFKKLAPLATSKVC